MLCVLPEELDNTVAGIKLQALGVGIDTLSQEQVEYLHHE